MISGIEDRLLSISLAYNEAKSLQDQYSKLITYMITYPPMTERHIASMEQELSLARQQLADLLKVLSQIVNFSSLHHHHRCLQHRYQIYFEAERGDQVLKKNISGRLNYYKSIRKVLDVRKQETVKRYATTTEGLHKEEEKYQEDKLKKLGASNQVDAERDASKDTDKQKTASATNSSSDLSEAIVLASQSKAAQAKGLYEVLLSRTGSVSTSGLIDR